MNSHGSFDWTCRTDTYKPYGPLTVATAAGPLKTTTIESAYNQTSVASQSAGQNQDISISASMNSHGSFDWTCRTDTYNPYGPITVAQAVGHLKTTTIRSAYNQTSVESQSAGQNEDISISASMNSHGSFDWTCRTDTYNPYGPITVAQTNGKYKTTIIKSAFNQTSMCSESAGTNEEISVSGSMNSHGSFDWTFRKDTYDPYGPEMVASTSSPVLTTKHYIGINNVSVSSRASGNESSSMSVSMNSRGTFDTHEIVRTPRESSKQATYTSGSGSNRRTHKILIYRNSQNIKTLDGDKAAGAGASINEFGLVDGSATAVDGGSGGSAGYFTSGTSIVETYIFFNARGGRRRKQRVTMECKRKYDTAGIVAGFIAGGQSYGPWVTGMQGSGDGAIGVRYDNLTFHTPEYA